MPTYHNSPQYFICPNCGESVPSKARACPGCGADEHTGWSDQTHADGLDLPEDFSYEEFKKREFGGSVKPPQLRLIWWLTAIVVLAALVWLSVGVIQN